MVAQTWYDGDTANLIFIPKGMIKKMTVLGDLKVESDGIPST
jgi:homogentisate 1,2-dioxygenase